MSRCQVIASIRLFALNILALVNRIVGPGGSGTLIPTFAAAYTVEL